MQYSESARPINCVARMWLTAQFLKTLEKRHQEKVLISQLEQCIADLFSDPRRPGLNLEDLRTVGSHRVLSARITKSYRLILVQSGKTELTLLYFDNHDEAYKWLDRNEKTLPTMLARTREVTRGAPLSDHLGPLPTVRSDEESPVAIHAAEEFQRILANGPVSYLTYLDPEQKALVNLKLDGLLLVKGGAGTGKTAVAIHRTLALAHQPGLFGPNRVLYLCYNTLLARVVSQLIRTLAGGTPSSGVEVRTFHSWCGDFLRKIDDAVPTVDEKGCENAVYRAFGQLSQEQRARLNGRDGRFANEEIVQVIKHNGLNTYEEYRNFDRKGRGSKLEQTAREVIWQVHERAAGYEKEKDICRYCDLPLQALTRLKENNQPPEYRAIVIDEGQDCSPVMIRLARRLLSETSNQLTVFADPAQAIYECGFQWTQQELKPRSQNIRWLRKTYRTTRQIYHLSRGLLDGNDDLQEDLKQLRPPERSGPRPHFVIASEAGELSRELVDRIIEETQARPANQIGVLAANRDALSVLEENLRRRGVPTRLVENGDLPVMEPTVKLLTMQGGKGLDFPSVFILGPNKRNLGGITRADRPEVRRQLYVALTRASERLTIGAVDGQHHPLLESLEDEHYEYSGSAARAFVNRRGMFDADNNFLYS